jgi:hypothetical protein
MGGIGQYFQLHTARKWVEVATDGDPKLGPHEPAIRRFRLGRRPPSDTI